MSEADFPATFSDIYNSPLLANKLKVMFCLIL